MAGGPRLLWLRKAPWARRQTCRVALLYERAWQSAALRMASGSDHQGQSGLSTAPLFIETDRATPGPAKPCSNELTRMFSSVTASDGSTSEPSQAIAKPTNSIA